MPSVLALSRRLLLETDMTTRAVAQTCYISESHLRSKYLAVFGLPPRTYIQKVKMKKAQTLLRITERTVGDIAHDLGYINASKFSAVFRRYYGMSPREYRQTLEIARKKGNSGVLE